MDFKTLHIRNFLTIGEAKLDLDNRGLLLIQGVNNDDPSASSNGAGKSSIVDALCWVLYGVTARDVTGDAVINETAGKDCRVTVVIEDGADTYEISRGRKDKAIKNALIVKNLTSGADLSKGTDKETQEVVNTIMGCSLDVFSAAVYAGQEKMPDLPGMTDKQLKLLIEEAAGVEVLSDAYAEARARATAADNLLKIASSAVNARKAHLANCETELANAESSKTTFENERKDRARAELEKIKPIEAELVRFKALLDAHPPRADVEAGIAEVDKSLGALKAEQDRVIALNAAAAAEQTALTRKSAEFTAVKRRLDQANAALADIESQVGKPCGECGKPYCEHDLETAKQARAKSIEEIKRELLPIATDLRALQESAKQRAEEAETFKRSMTDPSALAAKRRDLTTVLNAIESTTRAIESKEAERQRIREAAKAHLTAPNPWDKIVSDRRDARQHYENLLKKEEEEQAQAEKAKAIAESVVQVFGPAGVRAHILDTVTPFLNDQTADYLGILSDGVLHATWNTLAKTAKGDLKEKFNIEVTNDKGGKSFAGQSGGQKRKVRLATAMALQDMVASRASKPINLFVADEVDHALDEAGLERLMTVMERKARERGTVLVISHNSLSDWIDNVITAELNGGITTVTGATERGAV